MGKRNTVRQMTLQQFRMGCAALGESPEDVGSGEMLSLSKYKKFEAGLKPEWTGVLGVSLYRNGVRFLFAGELAGGVYVEKALRDVEGPAMSPTQARMARAALGLTPQQLRDATTVEYPSIVLFEAGKESRPEVVEVLQAYFEGEGVRFVMSGKFAGAVIPPPVA